MIKNKISVKTEIYHVKAPLVKVPKGKVETVVQFLLRNRLFLKNLLKHRLAKKSFKMSESNLR